MARNLNEYGIPVLTATRSAQVTAIAEGNLAKSFTVVKAAASKDGSVAFTVKYRASMQDLNYHTVICEVTGYSVDYFAGGLNESEVFALNAKRISDAKLKAVALYTKEHDLPNLRVVKAGASVEENAEDFDFDAI